jgi:hypothetical protein
MVPVDPSGPSMLGLTISLQSSFISQPSPHSTQPNTEVDGNMSVQNVHISRQEFTVSEFKEAQCDSMEVIIKRLVNLEYMMQ